MAATDGAAAAGRRPAGGAQYQRRRGIVSGRWRAGGGHGALGGGLGPATAGDEREGEHGLHPTTLLPRTQASGERLLRIGSRAWSTTTSTPSSSSGRASGPTSTRADRRSSAASPASRASSSCGWSRPTARTAWRAAGTTCWRRCGAAARPTGCGRASSTGTTMLTSSGTTKRLDRLEAAGLIARTPDPTDRRGTQITLTDAGHAALDATIEAHLDNERELIAALSPPSRSSSRGCCASCGAGLPPASAEPARACSRRPRRRTPGGAR